ncbi:MAG TPA: LuxR C-terminal-related transcriptional regulator [Chthonomonadaceae bacterium]|nr:LuxR C-terminal-related transcriptional regulator [Chthonomonadaceae bacterium]
MRPPIEVLILSGDPIYPEALECALGREAGRFHCRLLSEADLMRLAPEAGEGVVLLLPQQWEQLARWLPLLETAFPGYSWLLRGNQRVAGMFLSQLQRRPYLLLSPQTTMADLMNGIKALASRQARRLKPAEAFPTVLSISRPGKTAIVLTTRELEVSFAVSLGLSNRQIAQALHVSEDDIKKHVHNLLKKHGFESRVEIAAWVEQMLD